MPDFDQIHPDGTRVGFYSYKGFIHGEVYSFNPMEGTYTIIDNRGQLHLIDHENSSLTPL